MHIKVIRAMVAYFAALLGTALVVAAAAKAGGGSVDNIALPTHHTHNHYLRSLDHHYVVSTEHAIDHQQRSFPHVPNGPVYRCHDPHPEIFGPAPPVEDCNDVIRQFTALTTVIDVKLTEGCYQIVSGNCTGLVCPQRLGESTISGAVAAQYMASPLRDECIANGKRGWWIDGQGWGIGVYLT
ncbi:hypothetical protein O1611_g4107 [Lasiodiplodia mahajangana]|uniref:Uncharacterized protein n=1 Tax=Lasiodiplodia mahajangana TaxID=1108764 RepID=A0ACC2JQH5_9PEZI|nr:hypothetical protein O1611_g4107 [Lasiodiplodia mahajangana]